MNRKNDSKRKGSRMRNLSRALYMELREHRSSFIVYFTLRILVDRDDGPPAFEPEL